MALSKQNIVRALYEPIQEVSDHLIMEFVRIAPRKHPRSDWPYRIYDAVKSVNFEGVLEAHDKVLIAKLSSPVWAALGGALHATPFRDTTGRSTPPFAYGSGMGWAIYKRRTSSPR